MNRRLSLSHDLSRPDVARLILGLFTVAIGLVFLITAPASTVPLSVLLIWILTVAASTNLGITVQDSETTFGNIFVIASFLALGLEPALLITIAGVVGGAVLLYVFRRQLGYPFRSAQRMILDVTLNFALYGLSILLAGWLYVALGGSVPITEPGSGWSINSLGTNFLPLIGLYIGYFVTRYALFMLFLRLEHRSVRAYVRADGWVFVTLELVPSSLSFLVAVAALNMPAAAFAMLCVLLVVAMFVPHNLSATRARLAQRVRELDSLNAVSQAVANSLELPEVLEAIHGQVARLMDAHCFYIALVDEADETISFPLVYEGDSPVHYPSRPFGEGLTELVIHSGEPLLIKNDVQGFVKRLGRIPRDLLVKAWLGVPIVMNNRALGVMAVQNMEQPDSYDESQRDILMAIATQTATAIRNSQMYMAVRHQTTHLSILNSILSAINSTLDMEQILNFIVTSVGQVMGNQKAAIFLIDDSGQAVVLAAAHNLSQIYRDQSQRLPMDAQERSNVIATEQILTVADVNTAPRLEGFRELLKAEDVRAFAEVPLRIQNRAIGSLAVYYAEPHTFTADELTDLTTFANQAAIAVSNARLFTRADRALAQRVEQLATLEEIGRDLSASLDLDWVLRRVLERAISITSAALGAVGIWKAEQAVFQVAVSSGYALDSLKMIAEGSHALEQGLVGRALRTHQSLFITDVRQEPDYLPIHSATRSEMVVLIHREEQTLGVINLESPEVGRFDQTSLDIVSQLATQAAIAMTNAQLYQQAQARLNELSIFQAIGQQITSILNITALGEELTRQMLDALHVTFCILSLYDPDTDQLNLIAAHTASDASLSPASTAFASFFRLAHHPQTQAAFQQHQLLIGYFNDPQLSLQERTHLQQHAVHAYLAAPLYAGEELIGAVEWADVRADRRFNDDERRFATMLASQAAIAVQNARLFEDRTRQLNHISQLYQASLALTLSVELEEVLRRITTTACAVTEADAATLYLYDAATDTFTHAYALGISGEWGVTTPRAGGMTYQVVKDRQVICIDETHKHPEVNPHTIEAGIRSLLATPLISQDQPVGVLYVGSYHTYQFDAAAAQIVSALSNQAAAAVLNARLFADTAHSRDQLRATLDSAHDGVLLFDLTSRVIMVNPQLETMWNMPGSQLVGRLLSELIKQLELDIPRKLGCDVNAIHDLIEAIQNGQEPACPKSSYLLADSTPPLYVERDCLPVLDAIHHPIGWMVVLHDVTEERELQHMRDDLTDTIVHDLRSPLTSILGSLYILEDVLEPTAPNSHAWQALALSTRGAHKLLNLVNTLLDASKMRSGQTLTELHPAQLEPILNDALSYLEPLAQENQIQVSCQLEPDLPAVLIDEDKITRVVSNLLDNALKFAPYGGRVTLLAERWCANGDGECVRCIVRDNGPGIPLEQRERIFDRFVQITDQAGRRRGSGLGLNFCQLAVEAHGGKIWVDAGPEGGSEFSFTLPIATKDIQSE